MSQSALLVPLHPANKFATARRRLSASYENARTTNNNRESWRYASNASPTTVLAPLNRYNLRARARYEVENAPYAAGMVQTVGTYVVGTGPRLQFTSDDAALNDAVVKAWSAWAEEIDLALKLRIMTMARVVDGESFGLLVDDDLVRDRVKMNLRVIECDRVMDPSAHGSSDPKNIDGVIVNESGTVTGYQIMKRHPGDPLGAGMYPSNYLDYPAGEVVHLFNPSRAEQHRGVSELAPALHLYAKLRSYSNAVLAAAIVAAKHPMVIETDLPNADGTADTSIEAMDIIPIPEESQAMTLPMGWKLAQMKPEQPTTTFDAFVKTTLQEAARVLQMPFGVACGNSSGYNYSSGQLDHQVYNKSIEIDRYQLDTSCNMRIWREWLREASLIPAYLPAVTDDTVRVQFQWDGREHADPVKAANAQAQRLENNTTTLAHEFAQQGRDWETELRQRAKELALMRELGLTSATPTAPADEPDGQSEDDQ
jgi:lambda family phage portal protein